MIVAAFALSLLLADADASPTPLEKVLAAAQGITLEADHLPEFHLKEAKKAKHGFTVAWSRAIGESGTEDCTATYRADGSLEKLACVLEYVSHSMGPENARHVVNATRSWDASGKLLKVTGEYLSKRLSDGKVKEKRKLSKVADEQLADLSQPVLKLEPSLRP